MKIDNSFGFPGCGWISKNVARNRWIQESHKMGHSKCEPNHWVSYRIVFGILASILQLIPGADAMHNDFTFIDFFALLIGTMVAFVAFCACLGAYARRQS